MIHQGPRFRLWRTASGREAGRHARADSKGSAPSDRRTCTDDTNGQVRDRRRLHPTPRQRWPPGMRSWQRSEASHVGSVVAPPPDDHAPEQKAARMPGPAGVPTGRVPGTSPRSAAVPIRRTLARQHATCNPACGVPSPRTIGAATGHLGVGGVDDCPHEAPPSGFSVKVKGLRGSPSSDHVDVPPGPVRLAPGEIG